MCVHIYIYIYSITYMCMIYKTVRLGGPGGAGRLLGLATNTNHCYC